MSIQDIGKLLQLYEHEKNLMHKAAFYLAIFCGLRNSEIRALTLDDIDFDNCIIDTNKQIGDTDKEKKVIITTKTLTSNHKVYAHNINEFDKQAVGRLENIIKKIKG